MKARRKKITGTLEKYGPLNHATLTEIQASLKAASEVCEEQMRKKLFGRLADEPEIKEYMKKHFIIKILQ